MVNVTFSHYSLFMATVGRIEHFNHRAVCVQFLLEAVI